MDNRHPPNEASDWRNNQPSTRTPQETLFERLDELQASVAGLEKQISRAGREQFKANTLVETQASQLASALDLLRAADEQREQELLVLRERGQSSRLEARQDVARSILPALDGLEQAMRAGQQLLTQRAVPERQRAEHLLRSLLGMASAETEQREVVALRAAVESWLAGLGFVRRRLLDVLAAEEIVPIVVDGQPFDPRYHVAVEVVPASANVPTGMIAQGIRTGYLVGSRVLRHAEVAVAR